MREQQREVRYLAIGHRARVGVHVLPEERDFHDATRREIAHFAEATSTVLPGPYDVSLVEGSITTETDLQRIRRVREHSGVLVTIGTKGTV